MFVQIENFVALRGNNATDKYLLVTFAEGAQAVRASHGDTVESFLVALRRLEATDLPTLGPALRTAFELARQFRIPADIDRFGHGRHPTFLQPATIVVLTKGGMFAGSAARAPLSEKLAVPVSRAIGAELVVEPFRWDHRLFAVLLPQPSAEVVNGGGISGRASARDGAGACRCGASKRLGTEAEEALRRMCEVTGGRVYRCNNVQHLHVNMAKLSEKMFRVGPLVDFQSNSSAISAAGESSESGKAIPHGGAAMFTPATRKMLFARHVSIGWPIPESFRPGLSLSQLPARRAHPVLLVDLSRPAHEERLGSRMLGELRFPVDVYDIQRCALTDKVRSLGRGTWPVYVAGSVGRAAAPRACGFIAMSTEPAVESALEGVAQRGDVTCVLCLLPYSYPALWSLLAQLAHAAGKFSSGPGAPKVPQRLDMLGAATQQWKDRFSQYVRGIPQYYVPPLRVCMKRFGLATLLPRSDPVAGTDGYYGKPIMSYLQTVRLSAKAENDRMALNGMLSPAAGEENLLSQRLAASSPDCGGSAPDRRGISEHDSPDDHGSGPRSFAEAALSSTTGEGFVPTKLRQLSSANIAGEASGGLIGRLLPTRTRRVPALTRLKPSLAPRIPRGNRSEMSLGGSSTTSSSMRSQPGAPTGPHDPRVNRPIADMGDFRTAIRAELRNPTYCDAVGDSKPILFGNPYATRRSRRQVRCSRACSIVMMLTSGACLLLQAGIAAVDEADMEGAMLDDESGDTSKHVRMTRTSPQERLDGLQGPSPRSDSIEGHRTDRHHDGLLLPRARKRSRRESASVGTGPFSHSRVAHLARLNQEAWHAVRRICRDRTAAGGAGQHSRLAKAVSTAAHELEGDLSEQYGFAAVAAEEARRLGQFSIAKMLGR